MTQHVKNDNQQYHEQSEVEIKAEEYLNGWKRAQADLINFKKDEAKRIEEVLKFGSERILLEMIDIYDGLETALQHAPPGTDAGWLKGMRQAIDRLKSTLEKHDVKRIHAVGKPFDPLHHEAVQVGEPSEDGTQHVVEEFRSGYTLHGKVIRPARVKITQ